MSRQQWNERYSAPERIWSGQPSRWLVELASQLSPGAAADIACGEGSDAIWLASRGWTVTAVDFSAAGLARARHEAERAGVTVAWLEQDAATWQPEDGFDLVSVHYLHACPDQRREAHRRAWAATRGTLIVVGHAPDHPGGPPDEVKYDAHDVLASLAVEPDDVQVVVAGTRERENAHDTVVVLRRI